MPSPKYSIVLPTLNGAETLAVTVPEMLKIDRDDFELVKRA
jgi:glycosyltransferase involved in cell wall biosynthesis